MEYRRLIEDRKRYRLESPSANFKLIIGRRIETSPMRSPSSKIASKRERIHSAFLPHRILKKA